MEKRHKTAQLICILTGIIALWSELIWPSSLWPTFLPGSAVTHGAQGQRFSSHWWLEWHAQTSRTICGDCRSSASPAIVGFCHGKHYASTMRLLQYNPWDWNFDSWIRHCRSSHVRGLVLQWGATVWVVIPASDAWFVSQLMVYMKKCTVLRKWEFRFFSEASKWSRTPQAWPSWPSPSFCSSSKTPGWPLLAGIPGTKKVDMCNGTTMIWLTKCVVRCCEEIRKRKYVSKNPKWESHENHHSKHAVKANFLGSSQLEDAKMAIWSQRRSRFGVIMIPRRMPRSESSSIPGSEHLLVRRRSGTAHAVCRACNWSRSVNSHRRWDCMQDCGDVAQCCPPTGHVVRCLGLAGVQSPRVQKSIMNPSSQFCNVSPLLICKRRYGWIFPW